MVSVRAEKPARLRRRPVGLPELGHPDGRVISTGTPPEVGMGTSPPTYLKAGDVVTLGIDGLGEQLQAVVADG